MNLTIEELDNKAEKSAEAIKNKKNEIENLKKEQEEIKESISQKEDLIKQTKNQIENCKKQLESNNLNNEIIQILNANKETFENTLKNAEKDLEKLKKQDADTIASINEKEDDIKYQELKLNKIIEICDENIEEIKEKNNKYIENLEPIVRRYSEIQKELEKFQNLREEGLVTKKDVKRIEELENEQFSLQVSLRNKVGDFKTTFQEYIQDNPTIEENKKIKEENNKIEAYKKVKSGVEEFISELEKEETKDETVQEESIEKEENNIKKDNESINIFENSNDSIDTTIEKPKKTRDNNYEEEISELFKLDKDLNTNLQETPKFNIQNEIKTSSSNVDEIDEIMKEQKPLDSIEKSQNNQSIPFVEIPEQYKTLNENDELSNTNDNLEQLEPSKNEKISDFNDEQLNEIFNLLDQSPNKKEPEKMPHLKPIFKITKEKSIMDKNTNMDEVNEINNFDPTGKTERLDLVKSPFEMQKENDYLSQVHKAKNKENSDEIDKKIKRNVPKEKKNGRIRRALESLRKFFLDAEENIDNLEQVENINSLEQEEKNKSGRTK